MLTIEARRIKLLPTKIQAKTESCQAVCDAVLCLGIFLAEQYREETKKPITLPTFAIGGAPVWPLAHPFSQPIVEDQVWLLAYLNGGKYGDGNLAGYLPYVLRTAESYNNAILSNQHNEAIQCASLATEIVREGWHLTNCLSMSLLKGKGMYRPLAPPDPERIGW